MPDPNAVAAAARAWQEQGVNDGGATAGYGPLYDPETLRQQGVPPALVSAYEAAVRGYAQAQTQASDPTNFAAGSMVSQAGQRLRALEGQVTQYFKPAKADTYDPPPVNTSARYIPKQGVNAQYDVGSSDYAGNAPPGWNTNPNYKAPVDDPWDKYKFSGRNILGIDPTTGLPMVVDTLPDTSSGGSPTEWANISARQAELAWKQLWEPQKAQMDNATSLYGNMANNLIQAVPYMVRPGQEYDTGFEPGGIGEKWAQRNNQTYNPDMFRVNRVNYNPDDIMAQAWKMAAAGVPKPQGVK